VALAVQPVPAVQWALRVRLLPAAQPVPAAQPAPAAQPVLWLLGVQRVLAALRGPLVRLDRKVPLAPPGHRVLRELPVQSDRKDPWAQPAQQARRERQALWVWLVQVVRQVRKGYRGQRVRPVLTGRKVLPARQVLLGAKVRWGPRVRSVRKGLLD